MPRKAVVKETTSEKKSRLNNTQVPLVHMVASPHDQIKNRLREAIGKNLTDSLRIPEVVEGLVEYLVEVFPNDPTKMKIWGV